jgi:hypothetical protein
MAASRDPGEEGPAISDEYLGSDAVTDVAGLRRLVLQQNAELQAVGVRLSAVVALCDLSEWAAGQAGTGEGSVLVSDLRRALEA